MKSLIALYTVVIGACVLMVLYGGVIIGGRATDRVQRFPGGHLNSKLETGDWYGQVETYNPQQAGLNR